MKIRNLSILIFLISAVILNAQPRLSYMTPDIGAVGTSFYLEIIGPHDANGNFGADGIYLNGENVDAPGDEVIIETVDPADADNITFGPVMVSWDGRMVSTYVYINPDMNEEETSTDWENLVNNPEQYDEFIFDIRVRLNGTASNSLKFFVLRPFTIDANTLANNSVLGQLPLGKRSPMGAMLVDELELADQRYTVSTQDCNPDIPGEQGFLPFTLIATEGIYGSSNTVIDVSGLDASLNPRAGDGGAGGGGGGGQFCDLSAVTQGGNRGDDGGNGFTGGGRGGWNDNSNPLPPPSGYQDWGEGTGLGPNGEKGFSLNGLSRAFDGGYEASGGGTGHPFGLSGYGVFDGNTGDDSKIGGYGGGTGYSQDQPGGGGGYGTNGNHPSNRYGLAHGNNWGIPLAGGSGGASGNPQASLGGCAGDGGGGGGAIAIFSPEIENISIFANGGNGGNGEDPDAVGGGGSGGFVGVYTKLNMEINQINYTGGLGGRDKPESQGGIGYARIDYPQGNLISSPAPNLENGITTDTSRYVKKDFTLTGSQRTDYEPFEIFVKSPTTDWQLLETIDETDKNWSADLTLPGDEDLYYLAMIQRIPDNERNTDQYLYDPLAIMSHAATNILIIEREPIINSDTVFVNNDINCIPDGEAEFQFYIRNEGDADLNINFRNNPFEDGTKGFSLVSPTQPQMVPPGDSVLVTVRYDYNGENNDLTDYLLLRNNDDDRDPWRIRFTVEDAEEVNMTYIENDPDYGDVNINEAVQKELTFQNDGTASAYFNIINITNNNGTAFSIIDIQPQIPAVIPPGDQIIVTVEFIPDTEGDFDADLRIISTATDSTCSYDDFVNVYGVGVQSQVELNKYSFDYGLTPYCFEDALDTLIISNPPSSSAPFNLLQEPQLVATNDPQHLAYFTIIPLDNSITYPFEMQPDSEVKFQIVYNLDKNKGLKEAKIEIQTDSDGNELIEVPISIEIEVFDVTADPTEIDLGDVWVGFDYNATVNLTNNGGITKAFGLPFFSSSGDIEFDYSGLVNLNLESNQTKPLGLTFNFKSDACENGGIDEFVKIYFGLPCSDSMTVPIIANCLYSEVTAPDTIDLGILSSCSDAVAEIEYFNNSDAPFIILDESFEDPNAIFELNGSYFTPNDTVYSQVNNRRLLKEFFVQGQAKDDGIYYATYTTNIYSNGEIIEVSTVLKVEIVRGDYTIDPNPLQFENTIIGTTREETVSFTNDGPWKITIDNVFFDDPTVTEFEFLQNNFAGTELDPGQSIYIQIRFAPTQDIPYENRIKVDFTMPDCEYSELITVRGEGDPSQKLFLTIPDLTDVEPDIDDYKLPIIANLEREDGFITDFNIDEIEIEFNRTVFYPVSIDNGTIIENRVENNKRILTFSLDNISMFQDQDDQAIAYINGYTMLGDTKFNPVEWRDNISWTDVNQVYEIETENGSIDLTICQEGGDRLLEYNANPPALIINPNPADDKINIKANLLEAGVNEFKLLSIEGKVMQTRTFTKNIDDDSEIEFNIDINDYSNGVYYLILRSKTVNIVEPVYIIK